MESGDFNHLGDVPGDRLSPEKTQTAQARARGDSSDNNSKGPGGLLSKAGSSKQAGKYQVPPSAAEKASRQGSRTGSPPKKLTLAREPHEPSLQNSSTPTLKDASKNLALKTKLEQALQPGAEVDATTKKMIIGYQ